MIPHLGHVFVLSAPSGAGKSTLRDRLIKEVPGLVFSISYTTRSPREGEIHGKDYFFLTDEEFDQMVQLNGFVEWVEVYGRRYGTGRAWIQEKLNSGADILLDIETMGAKNIRKELPEATMIFLLPPDADSLARRLRGRGTESEEQIRMRLCYARHEMEAFSHYDYLVVNDDLEKANRQLESIILSVRCRRERMLSAAQQILDSFPPDPSHGQ